MRVSKFLIIALIVISFVNISFAQDDLPQFRIGFLEGGEYPHFEALRAAYRTQLLALTKDKYEIVFPAKGFHTSGWKRDSCKIFARELTQNNQVDLVVAMGPWTVHDLLEAGFTKPILAAHQYDPIGAGLLNEARRPIAENLALTFDPYKMSRELAFIFELLKVKKLGVIHFPSGGQADSTTSRISALAELVGAQVITAEGYDNNGTYAFFKAYQKLSKEVDAIYLTPAFGITTNKTGPFFDMILRDRLPAISSEGRFHVSRGAMIGFGSDNLLAEAYYNANQTLKIIEGATPADLPIAYEHQAVISVNRTSLAKCNVELPNDVLLMADMIGEVEALEVMHFDLSTAILHGLSANPDIGSVNSKIEMLEAQANQIRSGLLPQLSLNSKLGWQDDNSRYNSYDEVKSSYRSVGLELKQRLLDLGWWAKRNEASSLTATGQAELKIIRGIIEEGITKTFYEILRLSDNLEHLSELRRRIDLFTELVQAKEQSGQAVTSERIRWQLERLQISKRILEVATDHRIAKASLNILLGMPPATEILLDPIAASPAKLYDEFARLHPFMDNKSHSLSTKLKLEQIALTNNPDLILSKAAASWTEDIVRVAKKGFYPKLGFTAGITLRDSLADKVSGFSEKSPFWTAGINLSWPLFGEQTNRTGLQKAKSRFDQAGFETDAERLALLGRVNQAAEVWLLGLAKLPLSEESFEQANFYLNGMTEKYIAGENSMTEAKESLDIWIRAGFDNTNERYHYFQNSAGLLREIGLSMTETGSTPGETIIYYLSKQD